MFKKKEDKFQSMSKQETKMVNFSLLHVEVVDDDSDEEVEREEGAKDYEEDKIEVHVDPAFSFRLLVGLERGMADQTNIENIH